MPESVQNNVQADSFHSIEAAPTSEIINPPEKTKEEVITLLKSEPNLKYRLVYYALRNLRFYYGADSVNGIAAQDVVQIVLEKILNGIRRWNKLHTADIKSFLMVSINSFVRNECKRKVLTNVLYLSDERNELNRTSVNIFNKDNAGLYRKNNTCINDFKRLLEKLKTSLNEDRIALNVLDEILEGAESNIEIAKFLDIPVKDVENAKKRIKNKSEKLIKNGG